MKRPSRWRLRFWLATALVLVIVTVVLILMGKSPSRKEGASLPATKAAAAPAVLTSWVDRSMAVSRLFRTVFTPCWEGAYGALGDAYLFALTSDSSLFRFHIVENDMRRMCEGTWVDDRAWVCLAELKWWEVTGKTHMALVVDAKRRYEEARNEGRLSKHEGFWSWYNWPPGAAVQERIFTNSNMNQMATVACRLYQATGDRKFLDDALLAWNGDGRTPGIERRWYRGNGAWKGKPGEAAFGKELPWEGTGFCPLAAALYETTGEERYKAIAVATAKRILDPSSGWVDPEDFFQIHMDGNGAFVHFLLDAYAIAQGELQDVLPKVERMLEHVWTNAHGNATVTLHRLADHGIRNGWNPHGGEDGYGVGEVGTVHAQGEAARAFGVFTYYYQHQVKAGAK